MHHLTSAVINSLQAATSGRFKGPNAMATRTWQPLCGPQCVRQYLRDGFGSSFGDNIAVVHGLSLHSFSQASFARRRSHRAPIAGRSPATRCSRSMCFAANQASSNPVSPVLVSFCAALLLRCCLQHRRACNRVRNQVRETFVFCTAWRFEWLGSHNGAALAAPSTGAGAGGGDELALLATPLHVQAGTSFMGGARASVTKIRHSGAGTRGVAV